MRLKNNELYHYGVIGMKWGVRKAEQGKKIGAIGRFRSKTYQEYAADKIDKLPGYNQKDAEVAREYAETQKQAVLGRYSSQSKGKRIAQVILMGSAGTAHYHENRINGDSRALAYIKSQFTARTPIGAGVKAGVDFLRTKGAVDSHKDSVEAVRRMYTNTSSNRRSR